MSFQWCVMRQLPVEGVPRGAGLKEALWKPGTIISFGFMDGSSDLCNRVESVAREWLSRTRANLVLERRNKVADAVVRISFQQEGSWSYLGRYAKEIAKDLPTMNFGWLTTQSTDAEVREVVLHEFGHALGFVHEHQNPLGGIKWNRQRVIESLSGPPNNWSKAEIESNVLTGYNPREIIATPFDPDSIMLYPFPADWTLDGAGTSNNTDLSKKDIELANRIYGK